MKVSRNVPCLLAVALAMGALGACGSSDQNTASSKAATRAPWPPRAPPRTEAT